MRRVWLGVLSVSQLGKLLELRAKFVVYAIKIAGVKKQLGVLSW